MAWIESHTVLIRHRKNIELARRLRVHPAHALGVLHALWHAALEQQEDGDLSSWSDAMIADLAAAPKIDAPQFVQHLQESGWLDGKLLHDWLDYAGRYLESKYRTKKPGRLDEIWAKHGLLYGQPQDRQGTDPGQPTIPNLTKPTKPKEKTKTSGSPQAFKKPTLEEVTAFVQEKGYHVDPLKWLAHYESNGWRVGKNPMRNWKAAVVTWSKSDYNGNGGSSNGSKRIVGEAAPIPSKYASVS